LRLSAAISRAERLMRIVAVDHKAQRVGRPSIVERGDRHGAAAVALPVDDDRRQPGQRGAGQHVIQTDHMAVVIEIGLGPRDQVDRAQHQPNRTGIDPLEIDRALDQFAQFGGLNNRVAARFIGARPSRARCPPGHQMPQRGR